MNGVHEVETLISLAALVAAAVCVFPGWLLGRPESARRYGWRVACFIALYVCLLSTFGSQGHHRWWDWLWVASSGGYLGVRISANWRALELERKLARLFPKRVPR